MGPIKQAGWPNSGSFIKSDAAVALVGLLLIVLWESTGGQGDKALAHIMGGSLGFPMRHNFWFETVLHDWAKITAQIFFLVLALQAWKGKWVWSCVGVQSRWQALLAVVFLAMVIPLIKRYSAAYCPYDLTMFGGTHQYISHWLGFSLHQPESGHCFPAGHASSGFAFMVLYFWLRDSTPKVALGILLCACASGMLLGLAQQFRGAHFMSHTLWTAWLCWALSAILNSLRQLGATEA